MISALGLIELHAVLIALGGSTLWAAGLIDPRGGALRSLAPALGPAHVFGVALLMPWLVIVLLLQIPVAFGTAVIVALLGTAAMVAVGHRVGRPAAITWGASGRALRPGCLGALALVAATGFVAWGFVVMSRLPTTGDDARIWSLRGLTLAYYSRLTPEIFLNQGQSGNHPVYPLLQPELEATVSHAIGHAAPSFFHAELWLLFVCCVWTAGYLIWRRPGFGRKVAIAAWLPAVAVLVVIPAEVSNLIVGDADTTGSLLLALGVLCAGLWLDRSGRRYLALSAVMLTAAASTKDEDLLAAVIVCGTLVVGAAGHVLAGDRVRRARDCLAPVIALVAYFALLVAPWRLWLATHHLTDPVQPPIPHALNPGFIDGRGAELKQAAAAMVTQSLGEWSWLLAIFLVVCGVYLASSGTRRIVWFYLAAFWAVVLALLWLYATTPEPLSFLLPTSMNRTVAVFMAMTPVAVAHLLSSSIAWAVPVRDAT